MHYKPLIKYVTIYMDVGNKDINVGETVLNKIKDICEQCNDVHDSFNKRNRKIIYNKVLLDHIELFYAKLKRLIHYPTISN